MSSTAPPPVTAGSPPFTDARTCKVWLGTLPLTNVAQAQVMVLEQLRAFNAVDFDGLERLKCLELLRDKVAFLNGEQRSKRGKTLPLTSADAQGWDTALALLGEMEAGYRCCGAEAAGALAPRRALIFQRVIRYIGAQMALHAAVYRRFDASLWSRLHGDYAAAEDLAGERVKDSLEAHEGSSSVGEAYAEAVLMQAAPLSQMSAAHVDFAQALLRVWARKLRVVAKPDDPATQGVVVDLAKAEPGRAQRAGAIEGTQRLIDTSALSSSVRKRVHKLQSGDEASTLGLPAEASAIDALAELQRLHQAWCEAGVTHPAAKPSPQASAGLVFGLGDVHFFAAGGKIFEQPDKTRELTSQEKQEIEVFGRITERTHSKMAADHRVSAESWPVVDETMAAIRVSRPQNAAKAVAIGRLAGVRLGADFFAGMVSDLAQDPDGHIVATITLFPGKPLPAAVRAADPRHRATPQWTQGIALPAVEKLHAPLSFLVPATMGARGRRIDVWEGPTLAVTQVLQRGADFDRVAVEV